jgi:hypothetical protein
LGSRLAGHRPSPSTQVQDPAIGRRPGPEKRIFANCDDFLLALAERSAKVSERKAGRNQLQWQSM